MLVDIGVNLTSSQFQQDRDAVVARAQAAGVDTLILTGTNVPESEQALALCRHYLRPEAPRCYATAGIHPHEASQADTAALATIRDLLKEPEVVAVGETGLDFNRNYSPPVAQEKSFEAHLELAIATGKPLFLHERDAADRMIAILRTYRDQLSAAVIHCFTGNRQALFAYLDLDLHIGITGWLCDERRGQELAELVSNIPLHRLMLETDAPFLLPRNLPTPPKNRRNEPMYLPHIAAAVAKRYGVAPEIITSSSTGTARRFFRLPD